MGPPPKCHRAALIRLSVFDYMMQNEEIVKAEPKGMQINYTYIFLFVLLTVQACSGRKSWTNANRSLDRPNIPDNG